MKEEAKHKLFGKETLEGTETSETLETPERTVGNYLDIAAGDAERSVTEAIKTLRTNLVYSGDVKTVAVTSSFPGEGKSTISFQLAASFAELGKKTVYVDCDLRKSVFLKKFGIEEKKEGLSEFLSGQSSKIVYRTATPYLYVLPAGQCPPNPAELLSGERFSGLLRILKNTYEFIILDCPPIGSVIDAAIIGRDTDGTILVVRNDYVKRSALRHVQQQLVHSGGKILGVVMNRVKKYQRDYYYGKEYGKYYGKS